LSGRFPWAAPLALLVLVGLTYAPAFDNEFIYDDRVLILGESAQAAAADLSLVFTQQHYESLGYYRPLTRLTLALQTSVQGARPAPFHVFNVALMGLCAVLAYAFFRSSAFSIRRVPALIAAALVAVHPIAAQCVYPVTGRETLMAAMATVGAIHAFVRPGRAWQLTALALFALALLCKEQAIVVPILFLLADLFGVSAAAPGKGLGPWVRRYAPVAAVLGAYLLFRPGGLSEASGHDLALFEDPTGPFKSLAYAAQVTFAPFGQLVYEPSYAAWFSPLRLLVAAIVGSALGVFAYRSRRTSGSRTLFWLGWFVVALGPTLNVVVQEARFAERYAYLSLFGVVAIAATVASTFWTDRSAKWIVVAGLILVAGSATISFRKDRFFADEQGFNRQWLKTNPASAQAHANFGQIRFEEGKLDEAVEYFRKAIELSPRMSVAHTELANTFFAQGRFAEAIPHYRKVIELSGGSVLAVTNLGAALGATGQFDEAAVLLEQGLAADPRSGPLLFNLANVQFNRGEFGLAAEMLQRAEAQNPGDPQARTLGSHIETARLQLEADLTRFAGTPANAIAQTVLGKVLGDGGDPVGAEAHLKRAVELAPDFAEAHRNLGFLAQNRRRYDEAVGHYRDAIRTDPGHPDAYYFLARLLQFRQDHAPAVRHFRRVLEIDPEHAEARFYLEQSLEALEESSGS